jgi:hypothetical protein
VQLYLHSPYTFLACRGTTLLSLVHFLELTAWKEKLQLYGHKILHRNMSPPIWESMVNRIHIAECHSTYIQECIFYSWRISTNKEIHARLKNPTIIETIRLNRLRWFGHVQRMEENRIPKRVLYMNLETN